MSVIPTHAETAVFYIHIFGGILGGLADDVGTGCGRRFRLSVEAAGEHFVGPSSEDGDSAWSPLRSRDTNMLPIAFEVQVNRRMLGEGRKGAFSGVENGSEIGAGLDNSGDFLRGEGRIDIDV